MDFDALCPNLMIFIHLPKKYDFLTKTRLPCQRRFWSPKTHVEVVPKQRSQGGLASETLGITETQKNVSPERVSGAKS